MAYFEISELSQNRVNLVGVNVPWVTYWQAKSNELLYSKSSVTKLPDNGFWS